MKIVLTGGGTAGHVTPNIALLPHLQRAGCEIHYLGTAAGIERSLIEREGIPFHAISAGKLRRYLSAENARDVLRIAKGFGQSLALLRRLRPDMVFSKGGFVSCPVVWAAWLLRVPVVVHESDLTPGLANRLSIPFAVKVCHAFPETARYLPRDKAVLTGIPVREGLLRGNAGKGRAICGLDAGKPAILVIGGSLGAEALNKAIGAALDSLLPEFNIIHIRGRGKIDGSLTGIHGYRQYEYVYDELPHFMALADLVVSRAGATTLFELLALKKPNLLVPLSRAASRGDQIDNARSFARRGLSRVLPEEEMTPETLARSIRAAYAERAAMIRAMEACPIKDGAAEVMRVIREQGGK